MAEFCKVCICMPTYDNSRTVIQALESILKSKVDGLKVKVIDDQSPDNTVDLVRELAARDSRLEVHVNPQNMGLEANFNRCVELGEGEFLGVFHADDIYDPNILEEQLDVFSKHPNLTAVFAHARNVDGEGQLLPERFLPEELKSEDLQILDFPHLFKLTLKYANFLVCPSALLRTDVYQEKLHGYRGELFKSALDVDAWFRASLEGSVGLLTKPLMSYRVSDSSFTYNVSKVRTQKHDFFLVLEHYLSQQKTQKLLDRDDYRNYEFLLYKDCMFRSWNAIKLKKYDEIPKFDFKLGMALAQSLKSNYHRRYGLFAAGILGVRQLVQLMRFFRLL